MNFTIPKVRNAWPVLIVVLVFGASTRSMAANLGTLPCLAETNKALADLGKVPLDANQKYKFTDSRRTVYSWSGLAETLKTPPHRSSENSTMEAYLACSALEQSQEYKDKQNADDNWLAARDRIPELRQLEYAANSMATDCREKPCSQAMLALIKDGLAAVQSEKQDIAGSRASTQVLRNQSEERVRPFVENCQKARELNERFTGRDIRVCEPSHEACLKPPTEIAALRTAEADYDQKLNAAFSERNAFEDFLQAREITRERVNQIPEVQAIDARIHSLKASLDEAGKSLGTFSREYTPLVRYTWRDGWEPYEDDKNRERLGRVIVIETAKVYKEIDMASCQERKSYCKRVNGEPSSYDWPCEPAVKTIIPASPSPAKASANAVTEPYIPVGP